MRLADPTIKIIAWGDDGFGPAMMERLGDSVDLYAFHGGYGVPKGGHDALKGQNWRRDPDETWQDLALTLKPIEDRIASIRSVYEPHGKRLAMTEGHYCLPGRNRNDVLSSWAAWCPPMPDIEYHRSSFRHIGHLTTAVFAGLAGL